MKFLHFNSIRLRTIVTFTLINLILIVVMARFSYLFVRNLYLEQFKNQLQLSLRVAEKQIDPELIDFLNLPEARMAHEHFDARLHQLDSVLQLSNIFIFNHQWQVLSALNRRDALSALLVNKSSLQNLMVGQTQISQPFQAEDKSWYLWAFKRLNRSAFVGVRANARQLAGINHLAGKFLLFALAGILITILGALFVAHSLHKPLQSAINFSQQIGQGNFLANPGKTRIKELVQLNNALRQMRDALAQRDQEKEQMLAQIAHELRNPLGSIELLIGLVQDDLSPDHADQAYLQKVLTEVRHLKEQINEFLHYSRPRPPEKTAVDLRDLIEELKQHFQPQLEAKQVQILTQFNQSTFEFDREHLKQILTNLILNSLQAMDGRPGLIMLRCQDNRLEIEDNGPGIPAEVRDKIFQPFFTTKSTGVGLGLTICQKLCQLNNAQIKLAESAARGNTFFIELNQERS